MSDQVSDPLSLDQLRWMLREAQAVALGTWSGPTLVRVLRLAIERAEQLASTRHTPEEATK